MATTLYQQLSSFAEKCNRKIRETVGTELNYQEYYRTFSKHPGVLKVQEIWFQDQLLLRTVNQLYVEGTLEFNIERTGNISPNYYYNDPFQKLCEEMFRKNTKVTIECMGDALEMDIGSNLEEDAYYCVPQYNSFYNNSGRSLNERAAIMANEMNMFDREFIKKICELPTLTYGVNHNTYNQMKLYWDQLPELTSKHNLAGSWFKTNLLKGEIHSELVTDLIRPENNLEYIRHKRLADNTPYPFIENPFASVKKKLNIDIAKSKGEWALAAKIPKRLSQVLSRREDVIIAQTVQYIKEFPDHQQWIRAIMLDALQDTQLSVFKDHAFGPILFRAVLGDFVARKIKQTQEGEEPSKIRSWSNDEFLKNFNGRVKDVQDFLRNHRDLQPTKQQKKVTMKWFQEQTEKWHHELRLARVPKPRIEWECLLKQYTHTHVKELFSETERDEQNNPVKTGEVITQHEVIPLNSNQDLYLEGCEMHHCVGSYTSLCQSGDSRIFRIVLLGEFTDYYTCEISRRANYWGNTDPNAKWNMIQCRGRYNAQPPEAAVRVANDIAKRYNKIEELIKADDGKVSPKEMKQLEASAFNGTDGQVVRISGKEFTVTVINAKADEAEANAQEGAGDVPQRADYTPEIVAADPEPVAVAA